MLDSLIDRMLLFVTFFALSITIYLYISFNSHVGDITFDGKVDKDNFKLCNDGRIYQYYQVNTSYLHGIHGMRDELLQYINELKFRESGYITFRFIVNCEGDIGRFKKLKGYYSAPLRNSLDIFARAFLSFSEIFSKIIY